MTLSLHAITGAAFMGLGAGFLTYAYWDKISGVKKKKQSAPPVREEYYDPSRPAKKENARLYKAVSVGFFIGIMFLFYFSAR